MTSHDRNLYREVLRTVCAERAELQRTGMSEKSHPAELLDSAAWTLTALILQGRKNSLEKKEASVIDRSPCQRTIAERKAKVIESLNDLYSEGLQLPNSLPQSEIEPWLVRVTQDDIIALAASQQPGDRELASELMATVTTASHSTGYLADYARIGPLLWLRNRIVHSNDSIGPLEAHESSSWLSGRIRKHIDSLVKRVAEIPETHSDILQIAHDGQLEGLLPEETRRSTIARHATADTRMFEGIVEEMRCMAALPSCEAERDADMTSNCTAGV